MIRRLLRHRHPAVAALAAVAVAGLSTRVEYDAEADELALRLRRPARLTRAVRRIRPGAA